METIVGQPNGYSLDYRLRDLLIVPVTALIRLINTCSLYNHHLKFSNLKCPFPCEP